ncbi:hypothetical protein [Paenibacillus woosongensis]|uniref:hypothetical protein n=1 Tax=Paenibacillus woosongensis TaxID=307580 RepID=UPI0012D89BE0|nr:hypothetical protein [Paenibacillus woosongensis]
MAYKSLTIDLRRIFLYDEYNEMNAVAADFYLHIAGCSFVIRIIPDEWLGEGEHHG